ncbi:hypothetical protein [Haladaptatus caseinilyticus]|uniref:hypothetical protein n=1 Tax=Haladaptatus caseinilyticus TaxID=2993314 RepID=UPI00224B1BFF|nr:hypothetical protein [Haladaptatus caseinilyticus]
MGGKSRRPVALASDVFYLLASVLSLWLGNDITDVTSVGAISARNENSGTTSSEDIRKRTTTGGSSSKTLEPFHSKTDSDVQVAPYNKGAELPSTQNAGRPHPIYSERHNHQ